MTRETTSLLGFFARAIRLHRSMLSESMVYAEFRADGALSRSNLQFQTCFGFSASAAKSKNHHALVPKSANESLQDAQLWARLQRGETVCGLFARIGQDEREVWLQATYIPVRGLFGRLRKVLLFATDVTQRAQAEAERSAKLAVVDAFQACIEFLPDGTIVNANQNFLDALGYELHEIQGEHHRIFVHPQEHTSAAYEQFWAALAKGEPQSSEFRRIAKNGEDVWIDATYGPIFDLEGRVVKVVKFANDVTVRKTELADFSGQLAAIGKSQAVIEFAVDGTILTANTNFLNALGYSLDEIKGQHHRMFVDAHERESTQYADFWANLADGQYQAGEYMRVAKDGREIWIQATYNPIFDASGTLLKIVKYASDITEMTQASVNAAGQLDAIHRALAVIEFTPEGVILDANQNFLDTVGYTIGEVRGQHHRLFVDPAEQQSPEYREFWRRLGRGELDTGEYLRKAKGNRDVWIQASYNPIFDRKQRVVKVVKYATDITTQKSANRELEVLMDETQRVMSAVASGDLAQQMSGDYSEEFQVLQNAVNSCVERLSLTVSRLREGARITRSSASQIAEGNSDLSRRTESQAATVQQSAASLEELTMTVKQNADSAQQASDLVSSVRDTAENGGTTVESAVHAMAEINEYSDKIASIISVIDEIASQTNLLALNAAIEAARAGAHGKGFVVVASEVRDLAQRSAVAAKEIAALIQASVEKVKDGSELVDLSGRTLKDLVVAVQDVDRLISQIAKASHEQAAGVEQINHAVNEMDGITQQNASLVEQAASASRRMSEQAQEMEQELSAFRTQNDSDTGDLAALASYGVVSSQANDGGLRAH